MSETKFTEGEWELFITPVYLNHGHISIECNGELIHAHSMYRSNEEECIANAQLIATSPKLYEFIETHMIGFPEADKLLAEARGEV